MANDNVQLAKALQAVAASLMGTETKNGVGKNSMRNTAQMRQEAMRKQLVREAVLTQALQTSAGIKKISANLGNPARFKLDYKAIFRNFVIVEQIPDGVPLIYDKDLPFVPAVKVGQGGATREIEMRGKRVEIKEFEISARPKLPYSELYSRRYRALDRMKDRLVEGMELREDLIGFSLIETASTLANTPQTTTSYLDRDTLALGYAQVEKNRLPVGSVLMSAFGTSSIRRWQYQVMDQAGMQEIRETGYIGNNWGADFYVSDQIPAGTVYIMSTPKFCGWMPIRKDLDVIPADDPDNLRLGFVGYENLAMTWFNSLGATKVMFNSAA